MVEKSRIVQISHRGTKSHWITLDDDTGIRVGAISGFSPLINMKENKTFPDPHRIKYLNPNSTSKIETI